MLTLFTIPKPFKNHISLIQNNAIKSWLNLKPKPEIILFGNEYGSSEICKNYGLIQVPKLESNKNNTPFVSDAFKQVNEIANNDILCYVNTDIFFSESFIRTINTISERFDEFLIIGKRTNVDVEYKINFEDTNWENKLKLNISNKNFNKPHMFIDYMIFKKGVLNDIFPFLVGRPPWDNWFIWYARFNKIPVIDASNVINTYHQNHSYSHHVKGRIGIYEGEEAQYNFNLLGGVGHYYSIHDANFYITNKFKIRRNLSKEHFNSKKERFLKLFMKNSRKIRQKLGINHSFLDNHYFLKKLFRFMIN